MCEVVGHYERRCTTYKTPIQKRDRLTYLGYCIACGYTKKHSIEECQAGTCSNVRHEALGQRHLDWLCGGEDHPGIQA